MINITGSCASARLLLLLNIEVKAKCLNTTRIDAELIADKSLDIFLILEFKL